MKVRLQHESQSGRRPYNEDYAGASVPQDEVLIEKGIVLAVADGVGGHARGREAAEYAVRSLLADYYATPDTWSVEKSLTEVLRAINRWLQVEARRTDALVGMATTLSALVLRGRQFHLAHIGDSRAYLLRGDDCTQLSEDHTWPHPELSNVLRRALGLDPHLQVDILAGELEAGDRFLLCTDGVWNSLDPARLTALLRQTPDDEQAARLLVTSAIQAGSQDNCTALVATVSEPGAENLRDQLLSGARLPLPERLRAGDSLDDLRVLEVIHQSRVTLLYRVERIQDGKTECLVLKTLREEAGDEESISALIHEEWLARRAIGAAFPQVRKHARRSRLYYLMDWYPGETLRQRLERGHRFTLQEVIDLGCRLLRGLAQLHRLDIQHRDIKPDNLHLGQDGQLRILDLGVAASDGLRLAEINNPGTPSYMAPELFGDATATVSSDLYACAVTLYQLLTRRYPYGEIEPFQHPVFRQAVPPTRYRPETPDWLENILLRGLAIRPADRFETAEEFLLALERGAHRPLTTPRRLPLVERYPSRTLQLVTIASLLLNLVLAWLLSRHG